MDEFSRYFIEHMDEIKEGNSKLTEIFKYGRIIKDYNIVYSKNGSTLTENIYYRYGPKMDHIYVNQLNGETIYTKRRVKVRNDELITTYTYKENDCFSLLDGVSNRPFVLKIYTPKYYDLKDYNPTDVVYYTSDIKSCFAEYENLFGIDIDIPLPERCIVKKYRYDGTLAIAEYDENNTNKELLFVFKVNGNDNRIILSIDNIKDNVLLVFIKEFINGNTSPTSMHSIDYVIDKGKTNILTNKYISEFDGVPVQIKYDKYGLPIAINDNDTFIFTDCNDSERYFSRVYVYESKWAVPYNIRDCEFIHNTNIFNVDILKMDTLEKEKGEMERYIIEI